jgi:hypothetical protein
MRVASFSLAFLCAGATAAIGINTLTIDPVAVTGGGSATATLQLPQAVRAPTSYSVQLSSTEYASAPATVSVAAGSSTGSFSIGTHPVGVLPRMVTVTVAGTSATLTIMPGSLAKLFFDVTKLIRGRTIPGFVSLDGLAPNEGASVMLSVTSRSSTGQLGLTVPSSVTIPAGQTSASFPITLEATAPAGTLTITATLGRVSLKQDIVVP